MDPGSPWSQDTARMLWALLGAGWHLQTLQHRLLCFPGQKLLLKSSSSIFPKFQRKAQSVSSRRAWALLQAQGQFSF